uniref:Ig-like domain-containing protein n=1 Tax=Calidris pygmaea TaxID=425635 RepID=A0A8C3KGS2_9CHAR
PKSSRKWTALKEPPSFVKKLENITSILKGTAVFQCIVAGAQPLSVSWIKDEKILDDDEHHHITFENSVATLKLINVDLSHRGRYTCQSLTCVTNCHFYTLYTLEPAQIIEKAKSLKVTERDPVTLECTVAGTPELRIRCLCHENTVSLEIANLELADSANYTCSVSNVAGNDSCSAVLTVKEPPSFLVKPPSQQAIPDSTVEFKATLKGTPPFTVKWFKEDLELVSGPTCFIGIEGSTGFLTLYSVDTSRSGHYTCNVSNDVGSDSCTTTLVVTGVHSFLLCCSLLVYFLSFFFPKHTSVIFDMLSSEFPTLCLQPTVFWLFLSSFHY